MKRARFPAFVPRRWQLRKLRRARMTRWVLLASLLLMVGMQTAVAAYACAVPPATRGADTAMDAAAHAASMPPDCPGMTHPVANRPLCEKHCSPDAASPTYAHPLSVPPGAMAALPPASPVPAMQSQVALETHARCRLHPPGPPASLLFCSLLI